jgi:D-beta-D-heptose 7-phosphate kinase/D-beta-D-heptose 1-phosphate adenosyltransferase
MKKIFVNGSFDVLHTGHLNLLAYAKNLGDFLLVAIDSDRRISEKKGSDRPFNNQENRFAVINFLKPVDEVKIFDSDIELINIIANYKPDILVVGSDWKNKKVIGAEFAKLVLFFDRVNEESTTKTIESYLNRRLLPR